MQEIPRETPKELQVVERHRESNAMLAIVMAGLAGLFLVAVVAAYTFVTQPPTAIETAGPPPASPATSSAPETTGSGGREPARQVAPDFSQKQR